jgi:hypothetical protein
MLTQIARYYTKKAQCASTIEMTDTDIGREDEALEVYKGVVLGLYPAERLYTMGPDKRVIGNWKFPASTRKPVTDNPN